MKDLEHIYFMVKTKEDEKKWKEFLRFYFPKHYAISILDRDWLENPRRIAVDIDGFGYIGTAVLQTYYFKPVKDFEDFMDTTCYKMIVARGVYKKRGKVTVV